MLRENQNREIEELKTVSSTKSTVVFKMVAKLQYNP
jgi:hypothetical protein